MSAILGNLYNILLLTVDRLCYFMKPLRYDQFFTKSNCLIAISVTWVFVMAQPLVLLISDVCQMHFRCLSRRGSATAVLLQVFF